ncbi:MAG: hypothetical protein ACE5H2_09605 [Terriglobia bacterium]
MTNSPIQPHGGFLRDIDGKWSASRILAVLAYSIALGHILHYEIVGKAIEWSAISSFLVAVALPYLGNSVKNGLSFLRHK